MDTRMMHPDLAAAGSSAYSPSGSGGGAASGIQMHGMPPPPPPSQSQQIPHGGYEALQPSHQPSQHQQQHHQHHQHHIQGYPPASSYPSTNTGSSPSASSASSATAAAAAAAPVTAASSPPAAPVGRLGHVLHTMQQTGFHAWGFVIYRGCAYGDDAAWQRFLSHMKAEVHSALHATPRLPGGGGGVDMSGRQLAPYLEWTVMEDPSLEGASKDTIRRHFAAWSAARTPQRDGPGADGPFIESHVPRFMYCVYVDQRCLRTLPAFDDWLRIDRNGPMQYLACVLVDKNCSEGGEGEGGMVGVDGCERYYTGWMYAHAGSLPELYNTLGHQRLISGPNNYARPPRIYPGHLYGATMPP